MKKNILLAVGSFLFFSMNAQSYISLTSGASIPVGSFAKADAGSFNNWNNTAGFAKTGFAIGVEGACYLTPKMGIGGSFYFSDHGRFTSGDVKKLGDSYTDAFGVAYSTVTTTGRYRTLSILAGPQFSLPHGKFTFDFHLLGGLVKSLSTPEMTVLLEDQTKTTFKQSSSTASAFGWQAGAGMRYRLAGKLSLVFKTDYFNSNGISVRNENRNNSAGRLVTNQPLSWINVTVGVSLSIGGKFPNER
jgi:hypothetical protein